LGSSTVSDYPFLSTDLICVCVGAGAADTGGEGRREADNAVATPKQPGISGIITSHKFLPEDEGGGADEDEEIR